jgi:hypothetical protein
MIVSSFVPAVLLAATRKIYTFTTVSDSKAAIVIGIANQLIDDWQNEPDIDWNSLYLPDVACGTVTATNTFTVAASIRKVSDQEGDVIRIIHTDGATFTDYSVIPNDRQKDFANLQRTFQNNYVIPVGRNLNFNRAFAATDPQYGGTIYVNGYGYAGPNPAPAYLVNATDVIPIDIPNWLVYATAAQYDANDVTRQQLVPRLEQKANAIMETMKSNNNGQVTTMYQPWRPGNAVSYLGEIGLP